MRHARAREKEREGAASHTRTHTRASQHLYTRQRPRKKESRARANIMRRSRSPGYKSAPRFYLPLARAHTHTDARAGYMRSPGTTCCSGSAVPSGARAHKVSEFSSLSLSPLFLLRPRCRRRRRSAHYPPAMRITERARGRECVYLSGGKEQVHEERERARFYARRCEFPSR